MASTQVERSSEAREEISAAAKKAFAEKGFRATTMREISRLSGRSIGCIYHQFGNKEELISEVLTSQMFFAQFQGLIKLTFEEEFPYNLEEIGREVRDSVEKNIDSIRLVLWDAVEFRGAHFQKSFDRQGSLLNVLLDAMGKRLAEKSLSQTVDPRVVIYVVFNTFLDLFVQRKLFGVEMIEGVEDDELIRQISEIFLDRVIKKK